MKEPVKIAEEELNEVRALQQKFHDTQLQLGALYFEKIEIDKAVKVITQKEISLQNQWEKLQNEETALVDKILKKYGEGNLDLKAGTFTPTP